MPLLSTGSQRPRPSWNRHVVPTDGVVDRLSDRDLDPVMAPANARDCLEPAVGAGVSSMTRPLPLGLSVVRAASCIRTVRDRTGSPPPVADLLQPASQWTRLPLGFRCHRRHPSNDDASTLRPGPAFS